MPRCVLLMEYAFGILRFREKTACLVFSRRACVFFFRKCRIHRRFLIQIVPWDAFSMESVTKVFIHIILRR